MPRSRKIASPRGRISRRGLLRGMGAFTGAALIGGTWDCTTLQVRRSSISVPKWDANGFRVVQVSDIHANSPEQFQRAMEAAHLAVAEKSDLIALTGDYLDRLNPETESHLTQILDVFNSANCPIVAIYGNHDWGDTNIHELTAIFNKSKVRVMRNEAVEIDGVSVAGIDDRLFGHSNTKFLRSGHFSKSLLGLWHEPDTILEAPENVSLQLSGHSHGGEVCFPGGIPIHTPELAKKFTGGFYALEKTPLFVSKGVATVGPCRIYCPPEISIHTISQSADKDSHIQYS